MSIKATRKELKETFVCIGCGYCAAQNLLTYEPAIFYNYGVYGWNFSGYILSHSKSDKRLLLTTGYRNMIHNNIVINDYQFIEKYESKAEALPYSERNRETLQKLIDDLIDEIYNEITKRLKY